MELGEKSWTSLYLPLDCPSVAWDEVCLLKLQHLYSENAVDSSSIYWKYRVSGSTTAVEAVNEFWRCDWMFHSDWEAATWGSRRAHVTKWSKMFIKSRRLIWMKPQLTRYGDVKPCIPVLAIDSLVQLKSSLFIVVFLSAAAWNATVLQKFVLQRKEFSNKVFLYKKLPWSSFFML
jgi:hypothetical protein